jgi:hypothetical protein
LFGKKGKQTMSKTDGKRPSKTAKELEELLQGDSSEENIHQFFKEKIFRIGHGNPRFSEHCILGTVSKFAVTPDRIPDFTSAMLHVTLSQTASRVSFVELKKPSAPLYTNHGRMSKDLNDAWMECVETIRLLAENFRDFLRRLVKALDESRLRRFDSFYSALAKDKSGRGEEEYRHLLYESIMPWCNSIIVIGRRSTLDPEGLRRTIELSALTGGAIEVMTYDTVLNRLSEFDEDDEKLFLPRWW